MKYVFALEQGVNGFALTCWNRETVWADSFLRADVHGGQQRRREILQGNRVGLDVCGLGI